MIGKIIMGETSASSVSWLDPSSLHLVSRVSTKDVRVFNPSGSPKICAVDCGLKLNQVQEKIVVYTAETFSTEKLKYKIILFISNIFWFFVSMNRRRKNDVEI